MNFDDQKVQSDIRLGAPLIVSNTKIIGLEFFKEYPELRPDIVVNKIAQDLAIEMSSIICGEELEKVEVSYPKDWWEAFKEQFFFSWLKGYFPVKYTIKVLEARVLYPRISLKHETNKVVFLIDHKVQKSNDNKS